MMQQARADLMNHSWEEAEARLRQILAADPLNRQAHATLGEVYLSKYQYWYDYMLLDRELFPGISIADPEIYKNLAQKGERELRIAEGLPMGEEDRWLAETGPVEPGEDQAVPHYLLGRVHFLRGDLAAARREIETALTLEPRRGALAGYCHLYLGMIAAAEGDAKRARGEFESAIRMKATDKITAMARDALARLDRGSAEP
jgi:tetratricopeptide (TPR) repeat protein